MSDTVKVASRDLESRIFPGSRAELLHRLALYRLARYRQERLTNA
ncbi:hypothetical protein [Amycolatopsis anabasis]|nr:hypothetical protein [Amycolatopsis anabasis]